MAAYRAVHVNTAATIKLEPFALELTKLLADFGQCRDHILCASLMHTQIAHRLAVPSGEHGIRRGNQDQVILNPNRISNLWAALKLRVAVEE